MTTRRRGPDPLPTTTARRPLIRAADLHLPRSPSVGPSEASHLLGVSTTTLRTWADSGRLDVVETSPAGRRRYSRRQVEALAAGVPVSEPVTRVQLATTSVAAYRLQQARTMSEDDLLAKVRDLARPLGWLSYHTHRSTRSEPGFPDLVLVRGAVVLWRELKSHTGKTSAPQDVWLERLRRAGQDVGLWRPLDLLDGTIERTLRATA